MDQDNRRFPWPHGNQLPPAQYSNPYATNRPFSIPPRIPFHNGSSPFLSDVTFGPSDPTFPAFSSPFQIDNGFGPSLPGTGFPLQGGLHAINGNPFVSHDLLAPQTSAFQTETIFSTAGPVIHDGFIPTNLEDSDDEEASYPVLPLEVQSNLRGYQTYGNSFEHGLVYESSNGDEQEDESESEEDPTVEEAFINNIRDANNPEVDPDFSQSDVEEINSGDELVDFESPRRGRGRGRGGIRGGTRGRPRGRGRGRGRGRSLSALERRPPPRRSTRNTRGKPKGARKAADPGQQFKGLQTKANLSYVERDYEAAIDNAMKAIQLNPEIFATHSLLSEIYLDMGDDKRSVEALIVGAPTKRDKHLWFHVLQRVWDLDEKKYPMYTRDTKIGIAVNCLREILIIDPKDYEARHEKLKIELELGNTSKAASLCRTMLEIRPYEADILRELARICTEDVKGERYLDMALKTFEKSIDYFLTNEEPANSSFDWSLLNYYLEIVEKNKEPKKVVLQAKKLSRWLLGRKHEVFWDDFNDDREWDLAHEPRRVTVAGLELGKCSLDLYGSTLPMEVRVKIGINRLRMGGPENYEEAMRHLELLEPDSRGPDSKVMDYGDLFREAAEALKAGDHYEQVVRFYEALETNPDEMTVPSYISLIRSYNTLGLYDVAAERMQTLINFDCQNVQDLALLAKFLEASGKLIEARERAKQVYRMGGFNLLRRLHFKNLAMALPDGMQTTPKGRGFYKRRKHYHVGEAPGAKQTDSRVAERETGQEERVSLRPLAPWPDTGVNDDASRDDIDGDDRSSDDDEGLNGAPQRSLDRILKPKRSPLPHLRNPGPITYQPYLLGFSADGEEENSLSPLVSITKRLHEAERRRPDEFHYQKALDRKMKANFALLRQLQDDVTQGNSVATQTCLDAGEEMTTEFLEFKFFYYERHEPFKGYFRKKGPEWRESILSRLASFANRIDDGERDLDLHSDESCDDFHGITFDEWVDVLVQHSLLLAKTGDSTSCFQNLKAACGANIVWLNHDRMHRIHMCWLACAIAVDSSPQTVHAVRWFMKNYPFVSDMYRLYSMANRLLAEGTFYSNAMNQKAILRYIKAADYQQMTAEQRDWFKYNDTMRANYMGRVVQDGLMQRVEGHDPVLFALFGHTLADGGTYTSALNHYFRAYVICPDDPILNLCIGMCYVQHAMKRGSENRQYQVQQGMAFVFRYHALRTKDDVAVLVQEAEFNLGRVWHLLGLSQLALTCYRRCIGLGSRVREEHEKGEHPDVGVEDFSAEAAFAIQTILALVGDFEGARRVTEEALVIE